MRKLNALLFCALLGSNAGCVCSGVDAGNVGVLKNFGGSVEPNIYTEGLHWTGFGSMQEMSTRTQSYTMAGVGAQGESGSDGSVQVLSRDQLPVNLDITVQFHLDGQNAVQVFRVLGERYADTIVHPILRTAVRDAASQFTAVQLVDDRPQLQQRMSRLMTEQLQSTLHNRGIPRTAVVVDNILLRNITLPQSIMESIANVQRQQQLTAQAIQARQTAEQEMQTLRLRQEGEANAQLSRARVEAETRLTRARAEAESNRIISASITSQVLEARRVELQAAVLANGNTRVVYLPSGHGPVMTMPVTQ